VWVQTRIRQLEGNTEAVPLATATYPIAPAHSLDALVPAGDSGGGGGGGRGGGGLGGWEERKMEMEETQEHMVLLHLLHVKYMHKYSYMLFLFFDPLLLLVRVL